MTHTTFQAAFGTQFDQPLIHSAQNRAAHDESSFTSHQWSVRPWSVSPVADPGEGGGVGAGGRGQVYTLMTLAKFETFSLTLFTNFGHIIDPPS